MILAFQILQEGVWGDSVIEWLSLTTLIAGVVGLYLHHTCHKYKCLRPAWHPDPETGHPVCKRHNKDHPRGGGGLDALK
jgi:hypothetical protein